MCREHELHRSRYEGHREGLGKIEKRVPVGMRTFCDSGVKNGDSDASAIATR